CKRRIGKRLYPEFGLLLYSLKQLCPEPARKGACPGCIRFRQQHQQIVLRVARGQISLSRKLVHYSEKLRREICLERRVAWEAAAHNRERRAPAQRCFNSLLNFRSKILVTGERLLSG